MVNSTSLSILIRGRNTTKTENLLNGRLDVTLSYPSLDETGNIHSTCEHRFTVKETAATIADFKKFDFFAKCVPGRNKDMELTFTLHSTTPASVYVDDLELVLWD